MTAEQQGSDEGGEGLTEAEREDLRMAAVRAGYRGDEEIYRAVEHILADRRAAVQAESIMNQQQGTGCTCDHVRGEDPDLIAASPPAVQHDAEVECICERTPEHMHYVYYGATEPGSAWEWNPDCPVHPGDKGPTTTAPTANGAS